jgi:hypothetical protein
MKFASLFAVVALSSIATLAISDDEVISKVMKEGFKGDTSPIKAVLAATATPEATAELAALAKTLEGTKAPRGDQAAYDAKTKEVIEALAAVAGGDKGEAAIARLKEATNCKACHNDHKPE